MEAVELAADRVGKRNAVVPEIKGVDVDCWGAAVVGIDMMLAGINGGTEGGDNAEGPKAEGKAVGVEVVQVGARVAWAVGGEVIELKEGVVHACLGDIVNGTKEELWGDHTHHSGEHNIKSKDLRGCDSERFRYQPLRSPSVLQCSNSMISVKSLDCMLVDLLPSGIPPGPRSVLPTKYNSVLVSILRTSRLYLPSSPVSFP